MVDAPDWRIPSKLMPSPFRATQQEENVVALPGAETWALVVAMGVSVMQCLLVLVVACPAAHRRGTRGNAQPPQS